MSRAPRSIPGILTAIVISFVVVTYALSFALTALAIITTQLGPNLLRLNGVLPVYLFALISLRIIPANGLILITVLMAIFSACFWAAAIDRGGFIASLKALTRKSKPTSTNQSGVDVGFDFLVRDFKLAMNPPRSIAAAQKHAEKIAIRTMTRITPFAGIMRKEIRANRYTGNTPLSLRRLGPNWVVMIARAASAKDRA